MKRLVFILLISILLVGCKNSMKEARAADLRARTKRTNDMHDVKMAEKRALMPVRLAVKEVLWWTAMGVGVFVLISSGVGFGVGSTLVFVGGSIGMVQRIQVQRIPLNKETRQYDLLIYGPAGRRRFRNPNTGESKRLSEASPAEVARIKASTQVQLAGVELAGLITDGSKIINGEVR